MKNRLLQTMLLLTLMLSFVENNAQTFLEDYINEGLNNNIALKQKSITVQQAESALKIATSYFYPSIKIMGDFLSGKGGRAISIPVGDMLNPVYSTLNQLTGTQAFPQISNVNEDFFPHDFYDVKARVSMPLLNTDLIHNREIKKQQKEIEQLEIQRYKNELTKEIKVAYYNYLMAVSAIGIYENSLKLAEEAKRVNESLLSNGTGLRVYVLRASSEIDQIEATISEAKNNIENARRYFNFLLNKPANSKVNYDIKQLPDESFILNQLNSSKTNRHTELQMLENVINISNSVKSMYEYSWLPKINVFFVAGSQDKVGSTNSKSQYYLYGLQLELPLFEGFKTKNQINEAELEIKKSQLTLESIEKKLDLSMQIAKGDLQTALNNFNSAKKLFQTAIEYNRLVERGYKEGTNTFLETLDARSQYAQAEINLNIKKFKLHAAAAEYEKTKN